MAAGIAAAEVDSGAVSTIGSISTDGAGAGTASTFGRATIRGAGSINAACCDSVDSNIDAVTGRETTTG